MKKLITETLIILAIVLLGSSTLFGQIVAVQPPGDGSAATPWDVSTLAHLRWISETNSCWADTIIISADIDASETRLWDDGKGWFPFGADEPYFKGMIDGQGHVIRNLYINRPDGDRVGFVGRAREVPGSVIENLGIENCNITGGVRVGALIGHSDAKIVNCYSSGLIVAKGEGIAGGLIGLMNGAGSAVDSYSSCDVVATNQRVGGFSGGWSPDSLYRSFSVGPVSGTTIDIGGFHGRPHASNATNIANCFWDVERSGQATSLGTMEIGLSTADMMKQASFTNFDFTNTWSIVENITYPFLQWQRIIVQNELSAETSTGSKLGKGYVYNNATGGITVAEYGYIHGLDSLPWFENGTLSHGTKVSVTTGAAIAAGSGAEIQGADLPKLKTGELLYAVAYAIDSEGIVSYGNALVIRAPLLSEGSGTPEDPFQIKTLEQMNVLLNESLDLKDKHFILMNDIDATDTKNWDSGNGWSPIAGFTGTLDGDNHTILNLYIRRTTLRHVGFFGLIRSTSAVIKNLHFADADVTGRDRVGILLGMIERGALAMNCSSSGVVKGRDHIGGLVGRVNGDGYVYNSFTTASTYGTQATDTRVGGFSGSNFVGDNAIESIISNCYATGAAYGPDRIAGFIGRNLQGSIINSYSTGSAAGITEVGAFIGQFQPRDNVTNVLGSYWDNTLVGIQGVGANATDYNDHIPDYHTLEVMGLTTALMKNAVSFEGWDFSTTWMIKEGVTRPYLSGTRALLIDNIPVVTNQRVDASAEVHNISAANIVAAGFVFRSPDLSWSMRIADDAFTGPVSVDGSTTISASLDDVLTAGKMYSVQSYATDENGVNYYGDATFVTIEQEVYDATVIVNDEIGAVVAGATVTLDGYGSLSTDLTGSVTFTDVVAGERIALKVENSGYTDLLTSLLITADQAITYDLSLNTFSVEITVTDTAGNVLVGAAVELLGGTSLITDASGLVTFPVVMEASGIMYTVSLADWVTAFGTFDLTTDATLTVELEPRSLMVEVVDNNGDPVPGASVSVEGLGSQISDESGLALFMPVSPSTDLAVDIVADGFNIFAGMLDVGNESVNYIASLQPTMVRFIVTDENDAYFEFVEVILGDDTLSTGVWGAVNFFRVASGVDVGYSADKFGYAPVSGSVNLSNANDTVYLAMARNLFDMTFIVTDIEDVILAGAEVQITGVDTMITDAEGMATFKSLPVGDHPYVITKGLLYADYTGILSVVDKDDTVRVKMTPLLYAVTITVKDEGGNSLAGANVTLSGYGILATDADGKSVFTNVVPGNNRIYSVNKSGYQEKIDVLNVVDADVNITVTLIVIPYSVTLKTVDAGSNPIEGATVSATGIADVVTDGSGNAVLADLKGSVDYTVTKDGFETVTGTFSYADKDKTISITMTIVDGIFGGSQVLFNIFPNPATDYIHVELLERGAQLKVYDLTGRAVISRNITSDHIKLDINDQNSGIYIMKIWNQNGSLMGSAKFVIQK